MSSVNDFKIKIEEEDIYLYITYKEKGYYIKICFDNNFDEEYLLNLLKETISDTIPEVDTTSCLFYWCEAQLSEQDIVPLIRSKRGCGHFQLNLKDDIFVDDTSDSGIEQKCYKDAVLTTQKLREFFKEERASMKCILASDPTEPAIRKAIIHFACLYTFKECGNYPTNFQKNSVVQSIMEMFPGLKPIQKHIMPWFQMKVKNYRKKIRAEMRNNLEDEFFTGKRKAESDANNSRKKRLKDQLEFLKTCDEDDNLGLIKTALVDTLTCRISLSGKEDTNIYRMFPIFSKSLEFIVYDFELRFPKKHEALIENLDSFVDAASIIFRVEMKQCMPEQDCLPDIRKLCCILHHTKTPTANKEPAYTIPQMLAEIIHFLTREEDEKPPSKPYPFLIAQGPSRKIIDKYYLKIEDTLMTLPDNTSFFQAFDYLIQAYYVFNCDVPKILIVFFNFVMINIYEIETKSKYDPKKPNIEDNYMRPLDFLHKVQQYLKGSQ